MQVGDNPWDISEKYLQGVHFWKRIVRLNGFTDATRLPPGTPVRIPQAWLRRQPTQITVLTTFDVVTLLARDGARRIAKPGSILKPGERLITSDVGSSTLGAEDGSRILVRGGTEVVLVDASRPIDVPGAIAPNDPAAQSAIALQFQLLRGAIESAVRRLSPAGRFEIETPAAVAAVRGTDLRVSAAGEVATTEVTIGSVAVLNQRGQTRLDAEEGTRTIQGRAPEPASSLLPGPDLSNLPPVITRLPIVLPLPLIDKAVAYRAQFSPEPFDTLVSDVLSKGAFLRAQELSNGNYRLEVRAVDDRGLEGLTTGRLVRVHVTPVPPLLIEPAPKVRTSADRPAFRWSEAAQLASDAQRRQIRLQVARSPDFEAPLVDMTLVDTGTAQPASALAPGRYFWRLAAIDPQTGPGPWSDPQAFQRILPAPGGVAEPEIDDKSLTLRWPSVPGAAKYRIQVGGDAELAAPMVDQTVEVDRFVLDRPGPGVYFTRVQAIAADGEASAFSKPEKFTVEEPVNPWYFLWLLVPLLLAL